jgi:hypothetical protein
MERNYHKRLVTTDLAEKVFRFSILNPVFFDEKAINTKGVLRFVYEAKVDCWTD